jgi:predicted Zn-dependent protease
LNGSGKLYLVPLGEFSKLVAEELASYYKTKYGISAETLPTVHIPPSARNAERQQLIAEEAVDLMRRVNSEISGNPNAILIGLTTEDMYISQYDWRFSFSWREQGKYAVVSSGRMNLGNVSEDETRKRFRKMVTKNVGILYFHLPQSDDPRSVLYRNVGGIRELDYMGEEF